MNLAPTPRELELSAVAQAAFTDGTPPPAAASLTEACIVAAAGGRAAPDRAHLFDEIARRYGHHPDDGRAATVAFTRDGDACRHVPRAAIASVVLVPVGAGAVAEVDLAATARVPQPTIEDPHAAEVRLPPGWDRNPRPHDVPTAWTEALVLVGADCAGAAEAALDAALVRVRDRPHRGGVLADLQVVRHRVADLAIDVTAVRDAVLDAAARVDRAEAPAEVRLAALRAKAIAVDRGRRVTYEALRLAGGAGILTEHPWQRWLRRVKAAEPLLGSPRDHRAEIARAALARFR